MPEIDPQGLEPEPEGLGGWLILVAAGLAWSLVLMLTQLWRDFLPLFLQGQWALLTSPPSEAYHPLWAPLLIFEIVVNLAFIATSIVCLALFFRRSPHFPRIMIAYYLATLVFVATDLFLSNFIPAVAAESNAETIRPLGQAIMTCAIWVPYMQRSRRVHNTFVERSSSALSSRVMPAA